MENTPNSLIEDRLLTEADMRDLSEADEPTVLRNCDLHGLNLSQLEMPNWRFEKCNLAGTSFNGAMLEGAVFDGCRAAGASFVSAVLTEAEITSGDFSNTSFRGATLAAMKIAHCKMTGADFSEARASGMELEGILFVFALVPKMSFHKMTLKQICGPVIFATLCLRIACCVMQTFRIVGLNMRICAVPIWVALR
jgi:fluoroquinolone resistance protein